MALLVGDWLRCSGTGYPGGVGLSISADHTWNSLTATDDGACVPVTTGFTGYGTWTISQGNPLQFNLLKVGGGGAGYFPMISDTERLLLDFGGAPMEYVRASLP